MLKIGNLTFNSRVILAPMAGVCDRPFRKMVRRFDQESLIYGEMISSVGLFHWGRNNHSLLSIDPEEPPIGMQIFGHEPAMMAEAARRVEQTDAAIIDINIGCPAPKIVKNGDGVAMMKEPKLFASILEAVVKAVSKPVTVKMRLGWDNPKAYLEFAKIAEGCGASAITIHGRTKGQMYSGVADWDAIKLAAESVKIPVIGNGDVADPILASALLEESGCAALMVGRAANGTPWLINRIHRYIDDGVLVPEPSIPERIQLALDHSHLMIDEKGERVAVKEMRKHISWYTRGMPQAAELRARINCILKAEELYQLLESYLVTA